MLVLRLHGHDGKNWQGIRAKGIGTSKGFLSIPDKTWTARDEVWHSDHEVYHQAAKVALGLGER